MTERIRDIRTEAAEVLADSTSPEDGAQRLADRGLLTTGLIDSSSANPIQGEASGVQEGEL